MEGYAPLTSILSAQAGAENEPRSPRVIGRVRITCARQIRLSLSKRERMEVRDCSALVPRAQTRLLATRCRVPGELDGSKISTQQLHGGLGSRTAFDPELGRDGSYVHRRPIRRLALRSDSRNPRRNRRTDVGGEICSQRNFGSASVAKECVQAQWPSVAAMERAPQRFILIINAFLEKSVYVRPSPQSSPRKRGDADWAGSREWRVSNRAM